MTQDISEDQIEIIQEFIQESRDMIDQLEPIIIELGQSCQTVQCWETLNCTKTDCARHGKNLDSPCWLQMGYLGEGNQTCIFTKSEQDCKTCEVFRSINGDGETINAIFRLFHSMKGSAGFLDMGNISHVAHLAENLLDQVRSGKIRLETDHVNLLCQSCDFAKEALDYVEANFEDQGMAERAETISEQLEEAALIAQNKANAATSELAEGISEPAPQAAPVEEPEDEYPDLKLAINEEMVEKFVQEADELLQRIEQGLLKWADEAADKDILSEVFRDIHSFKGNCGFLGYGDLEKLSHQMETVLDLAKTGKQFADENPAEKLLELLDVLRDGIASISQHGTGEIENLQEHLATVKSLLKPQIGEILVESGAADSETIGEATTTQKKLLGKILIEMGLVSQEQISLALKEQDHALRNGQLKPRIGEILVRKNLISPDDLNNALELQKKPIGEVLVDMGKVSTQQVEEALQKQQTAAPAKDVAKVSSAAANAAAKKQNATVQRQDIRVDLEKLDNLINLIGEMVIAENMLIHNPDLDGLELENFNKAAQQMSKLVRELQEMAMIIRMLPVAGLFRRMIRLVHDISAKAGKKVDLVLAGEETEIDKTVIETISDPLVHLLRNSMDHGIEPPAERVAAGKPERGTIHLSACHEEGEVWITIQDDGRGLNRDKIIAKAIKNGLISGDGSDMSDKAVYNLIFQPGFSTADKITDISGRGVGMDVVKQNLEKIRGKVEVHSTPGQGTKINLRIPLTLAIIDGMLVRVGGAKCIVPILAIKEAFRPTEDAITITPEGEELVRVRENFFPAVRLHELLNKEPDHHELENGILIVLENQGTSICLFVDEILGQQQTVIKGLSDYIGNVRGVSGCTILGDGEVCLIMDVGSLVEMTNEHAD